MTQQRLRLALALLLVAGAAALAERWRNSGERALLVQAVCVAVAIVWAAAQSCPVVTGTSRRREALGLAIISVAAVLFRLVLLRYFPPANQTGFEELQTGGIAHRMLTEGGVPLEFRFTNLAAALGFLMGGDTLRALRAPFVVFGAATVVFVALSLRDLEVGWGATAAACLTAATLRWLVIGTVADELFASLWITAAIVWCLARSERRPEGARRWAAVAGLLAGLLMFEYTSYRVMVVLGAGWFLWLSVRPVAGRRRSDLAPFMAFLVGCAATALPVVVDIAHNHGEAIFFEAFRRHGAERRNLLSASTIQHVTQYGAALFGAQSPAGPSLAPPGEPAVPKLVGLLLAAAAVSAAVSRRRLLRALAVTVPLSVVAAALTANNAFPGRLSPLLPLLLVMVGALLDQGSRLGGGWARWWPRFGRHVHSPGEVAGPATLSPFAPMRLGTRASHLGPIPLAFGALAVVIITLNALAVRRMANARDVIREYCNDDYATAYWIGKLARPGQTVVVVTPDTGMGWLPDTDMNWLFADKNPTIRGFGTLPPTESLPGGALVVVGVRSRSLRGSEIRPLEQLATRLRVGSVQLHENAAHSVSVASIELPPKVPL